MSTDGGGAIEPVCKFECAVCLEKFRRPKILPCFHTFCQSCLQTVAGNSTSLDCPSCRKHTLLPPGGVQALQTNFYIEEEPEGCDEGATSRHRSKEKQMMEMCPLHPDKKLVLYCQQCKVSICIQCKVTQHEGHPAEYLSDKRAKAKVGLQNKLEEVTQQIQEVHHLITAVNERRDRLQQQGQKMAQDCQGRADTLHQWVNDTRNRTVARIQSATKLSTESLQSTGEKLQNKNAALEAQRDYIIRVLKGVEDADIVSLEAQLTKCQLNTIDLTQVREELARDIPVLDVKHNPTAINHQQLSFFVGDMDPVQQMPQAQDNVVAGIPIKSLSSNESGVACSSVVTTKDKTPREIFYSQNTGSQVVSMSAISDGRLWVKCKPGGNTRTVVMKLLDSEGRELNVLQRTMTSFDLYTITGDVVLSRGRLRGLVDLILPDGYVKSYPVENCDSIVSQAGNYSLYMKIPNNTVWYQIQFDIEGKLKHSGTGQVFICPENRLQHISARGQYCACIKQQGVELYMIDETRQCVFVPGYKCETNVRDVHFCMVRGVERLLVIVKGDNKVHMVDHTDGACFLGYLDTGFITLNNPHVLTTDNEGHLWVGCDGGSVVLVHL